MNRSNGDETFVEDDWAARSSAENESRGGGGVRAGVGKACDGIKFGVNFIMRNGNLHHKTPVSAPSDVHELEYVSALHQCSSMQALRDDGSLTAKEIALYLRSRHGLDVDAETVRSVVLQDGLTADKDDDDDDDGGSGSGSGNGSGAADDGCEAGVMDLVELTSALVVPFLLKTKHDPETARALRSLRRPSLHRESSATKHKSSIRLREAVDDIEVVRDALTHILEDCTGDDAPKVIDESLVKDVLRGFGEGDLAKDDELVREMVAVASSSESSSFQGRPVLDLGAFLEALTSDVDRLYDPERYERVSTNFDDVWFRGGEGDSHDRASLMEGGGVPRDEPARLDQEKLRDKFKLPCRSRSSNDTGKGDANDSYVATANSLNTSSARREAGVRSTVRRLFTGQSIDYTTDNYRTRLHIIFLWFAFAAFWFSYFRHAGYMQDKCEVEGLSDREKIVCPLIRGIVNQLLMIVELVIFGGPYIIIGSIGNSIEGRETLAHLAAGIFFFTLFIVLFYSLPFTIPYWVSTTNEDSSPLLQHVSLALGMTVVAMQCVHFVMRFFRERYPEQQWYARWFTFGNVQYESKIKRSGLFKVSRMLHNAHDIHRRIICEKELQMEEEDEEENDPNFLSNFGKALNEYIKLESKTTYIGGIGWTWSKMRDGSLFEEEGIWISGRIVVGTILQCILIVVAPVVVSILLPGFLRNISGNPDEALAPRGRIAVGVGLAFAVLTSITITVLFLPTVVSTILKFRRGALPSLRSEDFLHRYRFALDQATLVIGGMVFGVTFSSIAMALLTGGFVYLLLWEKTSSTVLGLVGNLLGLSIVLVSKIIVMQIIRFTHYAAFYRRKPLSSNVMTVAVECYAIGISIWFMVVRTIKIIVIGALYLGRIDTPLFASGIGIFGPLELDNWPTVTRKEILIHEAHRHPYIETLGYLYMMQLRYRNGFAKRACSAWRLIFVLSLMPWLHKYRDLTRPDHFGDVDEKENEDTDVPVGKTNSLFHDPQTRRLLMQSKNWGQVEESESTRLMMHSIAEKEDTGGNPCTKLGTKTPGSERAIQIKEEMKRLQDELDEIEARDVTGQEMSLDTSAEADK